MVMCLLRHYCVFWWVGSSLSPTSSSYTQTQLTVFSSRTLLNPIWLMNTIRKCLNYHSLYVRILGVMRWFMSMVGCDEFIVRLVWLYNSLSAFFFFKSLVHQCPTTLWWVVAVWWEGCVPLSHVTVAAMSEQYDPNYRPMMPPPPMMRGSEYAHHPSFGGYNNSQQSMALFSLGQDATNSLYVDGVPNDTNER